MQQNRIAVMNICRLFVTRGGDSELAKIRKENAELRAQLAKASAGGNVGVLVN